MRGSVLPSCWGQTDWPVQPGDFNAGASTSPRRSFIPRTNLPSPPLPYFGTSGPGSEFAFASFKKIFVLRYNKAAEAS